MSVNLWLGPWPAAWTAYSAASKYRGGAARQSGLTKDFFWEADRTGMLNNLLRALLAFSKPLCFGGPKLLVAHTYRPNQDSFAIEVELRAHRHMSSHCLKVERIPLFASSKEDLGLAGIGSGARFA